MEVIRSLLQSLLLAVVVAEQMDNPAAREVQAAVGQTDHSEAMAHQDKETRVVTKTTEPDVVTPGAVVEVELVLQGQIQTQVLEVLVV
jgi:hypothetical protein